VSGQQTGGGAPALWLHVGLTKFMKKHRTWADSYDKLLKMTKIHMKSVHGMCRIGPLREQSKCKLHLVGVQEVRSEGGGTEPTGEYTFFYGKETRIMN
jgi:predicted small metal-binding protein